MSRSALAKDFSGILEAVAWLQLLRCAFAGGFCGILGAFQRLFLWLQKAPLGTSLPSNVSQRPCQRLFEAVEARLLPPECRKSLWQGRCETFEGKLVPNVAF